MALVWSLATISCAFAGSYVQLFAARGLVGLGEAAYGTVGAALIATLFPVRMRSSVLGAFFLAGILGSVLGVVLGGVIAQRWGWQAGFGVVGVPGLLLAFVFLFIVRDYKTIALPKASGSGSRAALATRAVVAALLKPRTALVASLGAGFQLLTLSMTYAWLPTYFNRYYGLAPDAAGLKAGLVVSSGASALRVGRRRDRLHAAHSVRAPVRPGGGRRADCDPRWAAHSDCLRRQRAIRADPRRRPHDGGQRRSHQRSP
jgi:MFS family permease